MMLLAPAAAARAFSLGQPSRGATRRRSARPKLAMARAAKPIFWPSCGATRITAGALIDAFRIARVLDFARALGFLSSSASALAFVIGTRCYRGSFAAMAPSQKSKTPSDIPPETSSDYDQGE